MTPTRRLAAFAVAAMLVWSVAFGGGYTVALFSASAEVSGSFETDEFEIPLDGEGDDATENTTKNGSEAPEVDGTPPESDSIENDSIENGSTAIDPIGNESATPDGNVSESESPEAVDDEPVDTANTGPGESDDSDEGDTVDDGDEGVTADDGDATNDPADSSDEESSVEADSTDGKESSDGDTDTADGDDADTDTADGDDAETAADGTTVDDGGSPSEADSGGPSA
ncbi:hypothetical protein [Halorubrum sp. DTA46]|uniref:hypothetical protein n=1 Tax=Halorubrum sp. DTA46 TaxID=3402162 RepID=UPI003AB02449